MSLLKGLIFGRRSYIVGWTIGVGIAAVVGQATCRILKSYESLATAAHDLDRSIDRLQAYSSALGDIETSQRAFLLTHDVGLLTPYHEAIRKLANSNDHEFGKGGTNDVSVLELIRNAASEFNRIDQTIAATKLPRGPTTSQALELTPALAWMEAAKDRLWQRLHSDESRFTVVETATRRQIAHAAVVAFSGLSALVVLLFGAGVHVIMLLASDQRSRQQERAQRAILDASLRSIGDAVISTDAAGNIAFMNSTAERITAWPHDEAQGQPVSSVFRIIGEQSRAPVDNPVLKVLQSGSIVELANHTLLIAKDGREVPIDDSGAPILDENGALRGVILVFRDITARRKTQRELEESERRYRLLFESNPQPMWVYDQQTLQFLAVNKAAVRLYGYTEQEFLGMTLCDIRPTEDVQRLLEATAIPTSTLHSEGPWRHKRKDGSVITVEITEHPLRIGGRDGCLVLPTDITERTRLQAQLLQAQRLESIGRLAGGIAHDFNNLLTVINGYSALLLSSTKADHYARESLLEIQAAGEQAASLTEQLLAFSRKQIAQPAIVNLNEIVHGMERMLRRLIGEDIHLIVRLGTGLGNVRADPGQIQQVVMNLVVNARDAVCTGGTISIETRNVALAGIDATEANSRHSVAMSVSDTGTGIPDEIRQKIFDPFFTTKPAGRGTGLGLSTVHGMVTQNEGRITVETEVGHGTTFTVLLPTTNLPSEGAVKLECGELGGNETILVVEDHAEVRRFVTEALRSYGYTVYDVESADGALRLAREIRGNINLLVSDMIMPGRTGRELARVIRRERSETRVLFISGYTDKAMASLDDLDDGAGFLPKPFTPEQLARKVRAVLGAAR